MAVKVVEIEPEQNIDHFVELLNRNRDHRVYRERFEWLYLNNPHGKAKVWWVIDEKTDKPVAFTCALPRLVKVEGKDILCWNCGDFSVDKKFRTLGVALKLRRAAKDAVDNNEVKALYAHPNDKMKVIHQRVGHTCIGKMKRYAKALKADKYVERYIKSKLPAKLISPVINTGLSLIDFFIVQKDRKYKTELVSGKRFDHEYDHLFEELSGYFKVIGERNSSYLNWRYEDNPLYSCSRIIIREDGFLKGYIIFTTIKNVVHIKDIFCKPDDKIVKTMLNALVKELRKTNKESVSVALKDNNPVINILQKAGFRLRSDESSIYAYAGGIKEIRDIWLNGDNWYMTVGDRDV